MGRIAAHRTMSGNNPVKIFNLDLLPKPILFTVSSILKIKKMPESIKTRIRRWMYNFYPVYRRTGARIIYIDDS